MTSIQELRADEDAEQARTLSRGPLDLPFDRSTGLITHGPFRGRDLQATVEQILAGHRQSGLILVPRLIIRTPWWRPWRTTSTLRLTVHAET